MAKEPIFCISLLLIAQTSRSSYVFHENTRILFQPEYNAEYFGFSTILSPEGLLVGAPKAQEPGEYSTGIKPGIVFNCSLQDLDVKNVSCAPLKRSGKTAYSDFYVRSTEPRCGAPISVYRV